MQSSDLRLGIDPNHSREFGPCECCGKMTKRVWGYVYEQDSACAAYFVEWTPNHPYSEANFDLIYGLWGDNATAKDRKAVSVAYRRVNSAPAFMVIDAANRPVGTNVLVGSAATRDEVMRSDLRDITFAICDAIYLDDPRIEELRNPASA